MENNKRSYIYMPIIFALLLSTGVYIGQRFGEKSGILSTNNSNLTQKQLNKLNIILDYIDKDYVDTINRTHLIDKTLETLVSNLDPHSAYIPSSELAEMTEPLEGNFEGIGVEFSILKDTIIVITPISGGPSEALGILPGDRIVKINGKNVTGIKITNEQVIKHLRGKKGTEVNVSILRKHRLPLINYKIIRDKIPIYSVDVSYMITPNTGYIKISRFGSTTYQEFMQGLAKLDRTKMQNLIVDLRGNGGGYLNTAIQICQELLEKGKMIVYTNGRAKGRDEFRNTKDGIYKNDRLYVLVDESSASASEIVAGAIQDNDRGIIVGRRTFGKGLVQDQLNFDDGSAVRLTIARYYTPTGRCIQKPYTNGIEEYYMESYKRFAHGEIENKDSIKVDKSQKFITPAGKVVYGGGGITPDVFVPLDTTDLTPFFSNLARAGLIRQFAFDYSDQNRAKLKALKTVDNFEKLVTIDEPMFNQFLDFARKNRVTGNQKEIKKSEILIKTQLKALICRDIFNNEGFYPIINKIDNTITETLNLISKKR